MIKRHHWRERRARNTLKIRSEHKVIEKDNEKEPKRGRGIFDMSPLEQMKIDLKGTS